MLNRVRSRGLPSALIFGLFLIACLSGPLWPRPSSAQTHSGSINVRVSDIDNELPIPQADVQLYVFGQGGYVQHAIGDGGGRVTFNVAGGAYRLNALAHGYETSAEEVNVVPGESYNVNLRLRPNSEPRKPEGAGSISVAELAVPRDAQHEFNAGVATLISDPRASIPHFREAAKLYPQYAEAWFSLAIAYTRLNQSEDAQSSLSQAVKIDPKLSSAYLLRGRLYIEAREFQKAEAVLLESIRLSPLSWNAHYELARCYYNLGRLQEAQDHAVQARDAPDSPPTSHLLLVDVYLKRNLRSEALTELQAFAKAAPDSPLTPRVKKKIEQLSKD